MAWIYLAESEESGLLCVLGSEPSPTAKEIDMPKLCCFHGCGTVHSIRRQSGQTFRHSEPGCYLQCESTSYSADSPVRTLALQAMASAWKESEADFFSRSLDSRANSDQPSFFSRMFLQSEPVAGKLWGKLWPASGMIVDGMLYPLKKSAHRTSEKDGSCLLPTPVASTYGSNQGGASGRTGKVRHSLESMARKNLWPTPRTQDAYQENPATARARMERLKSEGRATGGVSQLAGSVMTWNEGQHGGALNPTWVEWLMGYPLEWTVLEDWATQWFHFKRGKRSKG